VAGTHRRRRAALLMVLRVVAVRRASGPGRGTDNITALIWHVTVARVEPPLHTSACTSGRRLPCKCSEDHHFWATRCRVRSLLDVSQARPPRTLRPGGRPASRRGIPDASACARGAGSSAPAVEVRPRALRGGKSRAMFGPSTASPLEFRGCSRCGHATVCQDGLCLDCAEIHRWSSANRAFCALIHRNSPVRLKRAESGHTA
jgi:hypothetical protein